MAITVHGMWGSPEYKSWNNMKNRCFNPNVPEFKDYGGRGITVAQEFLSFADFYRIMGSRPKGTSLDRINNNGHYEPGNCRWAPRKIQNRNNRRTKLLTFRGETKSATDWAEALGIKPNTLHHRMSKYGWSVERTLTTP